MTVAGRLGSTNKLVKAITRGAARRRMAPQSPRADDWMSRRAIECARADAEHRGAGRAVRRPT
jgi:hypothetical protein